MTARLLLLAFFVALSCTGVQAAELDKIEGVPSAYQSRFFLNCASHTDCVGSFTPVPENKVLRATNVTCTAGYQGLSDPERTAQFIMREGQTLASAKLMDFIQASVNKSGNIFSINQQVLSYFEAGEKPRITLGFN